MVENLVSNICDRKEDEVISTLSDVQKALSPGIALDVFNLAVGCKIEGKFVILY